MQPDSSVDKKSTMLLVASISFSPLLIVLVDDPSNGVFDGENKLVWRKAFKIVFPMVP